MASVDDRVVKIEFDNEQFERKISDTLASLGKLEKALEFKGGAQGLSGLSQAANHFDLSGIAAGVENISSKFHALGAIGFSVIQSLTQQVLGFIKQTSQDVLGPIITGGTSRAKNIEQAKFMFRGLGLDVTEGMKNALDAVKGTAFGLDEAAKAAAQFGASGIKLGSDMSGALRGVAGAAAMTGSSFSEMADIFAGSAGTGKVTNQDLMQFATRGLNAAAAVGKQLGKTEAQVHEMATAGTLDFKTFAGAMDKAFGAHATEANQTFTGSLANMHAAMSRLGAAIIGPQLSQQRDLFNAITPVIDNLTAALKPLIDTFSALTGLAGLATIDKLGKINFDSLKAAIPAISAGFVNIFKAINQIVSIGKLAFRDIFPKGTTSILLTIATAFQKVTSYLIVGGETADKIRTIFGGLFSIFSIGFTIIKNLVIFIGQLIASLAGLSGGSIVDIIVKVAEFLKGLQEVLVTGGGIENFFKNLTEWIKAPIPFLKELTDFIKGLFSGFDTGAADAVDKGLGRISDRFANLSSIVSNVGKIWDPVEKALGHIFDVLDTIWGGIRDWFQQLGQKIAATMGKGDFDAVLDAVNVGLLGGIAALLAKFIKSGFTFDIGGGMFQKLGQTFEQLTGVLKSMQTQIKADALVKIAIAIGILTASLLVLSLIDSVALTKALTAMAIGFGQLIGAFALLNQMSSGTRGAVNFTTLAAGMIVLAVAIAVLAVAVKILATMNWDELARGLVGVTVLLGLLTVVSKPLAKNSAGMIRAGVGILAVATALVVLGLAMKIFASMSWSEIVKGLVTMAAALLIIGLAMQLMPDLVLLGAGLLLVAVAMTILAGAIKIMGSMSWSEIGKGLLVMAASLIIIGAALHLMPDLVLLGAGLILVAIALNGIATAMKIFASMSLDEILRGLLGMAGSLLVLAAGLHAIETSILGAAALIIVVGALGALAVVLKTFGSIKFGDLLKALGGIALALGLLAVMAMLLEPVIPIMLALGIALIALGAGFALIGVSAYLLAGAFEKLAKSGKEGVKAFGGLLEELGKAIPAFARGLAEGFIELIVTIADAAPVIAKAIGALLEHIIDTVVKLIPKIAKAFGEFIDAGVLIIYTKGDMLIQAGLFLLLSLLKGINEHIEEIATLAGDIIVNFLTGLNKNADKIITAGLDLLLSFIFGIANNVDLILNVVGTIVTKFISALVGLYGDIIKAGADALVQFLKGIADNVLTVAWTVVLIVAQLIKSFADMALTIAQAGTDALIAFLKGITDNALAIAWTAVWIIVTLMSAVGQMVDVIVTTAVSVILTFLDGLSKNAQKLIDGGIAFLRKLLEGISKGLVELAGTCLNIIIEFNKQLRKTIDQHVDELRESGRLLLGAVINGMTLGLAGKMEEVGSKFVSGLGGVVGKGKSFLKVVGDPYSLVFMHMGEAMMNGMSMALDADTTVEDSAVGVIGRAKDVFTSSLATISSSLGSMEEFNPTITPVLDLTQVAADASKISDYIQTSQALVPSFSLNQARTIASSTNAQQDISPVNAPGENAPVKFEQNIYAPTQLSTSDIYKQTRNQITMAKEELSIP